MLYYRHRHGYYSLAQPSPLTRFIRPAIGAVLLVIVFYFAGSWLMGKLGIGNHTRQAAVVLQTENAGGVQVSLDGKDYTSAQNDIKLYVRDRVKTAANGKAALLFFDGSVIRLNAQSEAEVTRSDLKSTNSLLSLALTAGDLWVTTPRTAVFSGSIVRTISTGDLSFEIPAQTEALIGKRSVAVFSAAGLGVKITIPRAVIPVIVGVGQQFALPENFRPEEDLYQYRSPLSTLAAVSPFMEESRSLYGIGGSRSSASSVPGGTSSSTSLTVTSPENNTTIRTATVKVEGSVGEKVDALRVNGYQASIKNDRTFSIEVSPPDEDQVSITVEALDATGNVMETVVRQLIRDRRPPEAPTITEPAKDGQTYRTQKTEIVIRGTAPAGAAGIIVNDYRLQLFDPAKGTWSYLASTRLDNFKEGENLFTVTAVNESGTKSPAVTLTVILGGEGEGVVSSASSAGQSSSVAEVTEDTLPKNDPIMPGTLKVTAPGEGTAYTFTGTGSSFLLEGVVPKETSSVWVNGYKLRLYVAGKTFFNYIADAKYSTLKKGLNTYVINARNAEGKILDTLTYTVTY
ncbi:MAG: FecR domain-containing protein [Candidatus Peribacteraceae bacterium]|nr:FecR domain-containing protein [Candidatus Peribacteraceae bacterium]MDD5074327.1 FecR domain-containing protein [Candidatus Peribacteraceae bacterium]